MQPSYTLSLIVACDRNGAIGKAGALPWHLSDDLKFFKKTTMGAPIVMGRKTYESIGRPLPGRTNIVLSKQMKPEQLPHELVWINQLDQLLHWLNTHITQGEVFVIGGGQIYKELLPHCKRAYITHVETQVNDADTFFPIEQVQYWQKEILAQITSNDKNQYDAVVCCYTKA
jgi:dihydrofolate reductase